MMSEQEFVATVGTKTIQFYDKQFEWLQSDARLKAFVGDRGAGKTYMLAVAALQKLITSKCNGMLVAPTYMRMRDGIWDRFITLAGGEIQSVRSCMQQVEFPNGSVVRFRSGEDPNELRDRTRGLRNSFVGIDDAQHVDEEVWQACLDTLEPDGVAWITRGRSWFERIPGVACDSIYDNPFSEWLAERQEPKGQNA